MAFFDKLSEIARNVGEMTNDALENSRKGSQMSSEMKKIRELKEQLGDIAYEKYKNGEAADERILEICAQIDESQKIVDGLQAELEAIKKEQEEQERLEAERQAQESEGIACACGNVNPPGTKFCAECGAKLETPIPQGDKFCTECGAKNKIDTKFCAECGNQF